MKPKYLSNTAVLVPLLVIHRKSKYLSTAAVLVPLLVTHIKPYI